MKLTVYIMSVIVLLLVAGGFPLMGAEGVYKSGLMILLFGLLAVLTVICCFRQQFKISKLGFYLSHIGAVVILAGALAGFIWSENVNFWCQVGDGFYMDQVYDQSNPEKVFPLDFSFNVSDFKVDKFDPSYSLVKKDLNSADGLINVKTYKLIDGKIILDDHMGTVPESELKDSRGLWKPHYFINNEYMLMRNKSSVKWYSAEFNIKDGNDIQTFDLAVNHPVSYNGWRFYLIDPGTGFQGRYIGLKARRDPGRFAVIAGMWMVIAGVFMVCLLRRRET